VRELSVTVVLAPAIANPDDAEPAPFAPPVRSPMASPPSPWPEIAVWGSSAGTRRRTGGAP
jgi:hypothetical protein